VACRRPISLAQAGQHEVSSLAEASLVDDQGRMCPLPTSPGRRMIALSALLLLLQPVLDLRDREEAVRHIDLSGPMAVEIPANSLDAVKTPFPNLPARQ